MDDCLFCIYEKCDILTKLLFRLVEKRFNNKCILFELAKNISYEYTRFYISLFNACCIFRLDEKALECVPLYLKNKDLLFVWPELLNKIIFDTTLYDGYYSSYMSAETKKWFKERNYTLNNDIKNVKYIKGILQNTKYNKYPLPKLNKITYSLFNTKINRVHLKAILSSSVITPSIKFLDCEQCNPSDYETALTLNVGLKKKLISLKYSELIKYKKCIIESIKKANICLFKCFVREDLPYSIFLNIKIKEESCPCYKSLNNFHLYNVKNIKSVANILLKNCEKYTKAQAFNILVNNCDNSIVEEWIFINGPIEIVKNFNFKYIHNSIFPKKLELFEVLGEKINEHLGQYYYNDMNKINPVNLKIFDLYYKKYQNGDFICIPVCPFPYAKHSNMKLNIIKYELTTYIKHTNAWQQKKWVEQMENIII